MAFGNLIITAAGQSMLASAQVGGGIITPTTISAGNGFVSGTDDPTTFAALKSLKWAGVLPTAISALTPKQATVTVDFVGSLAPSSFKLNEIGIYAKQGAGAPILFAYTSRAADDGDTLSAGVIRTYALVTGYSNVTAVSLIANLVPAISAHAPTHIISDANPIPTDPLPVATTITTGLLPRLTGFLTDIFTGQSWKTIWAALAGTDPQTVLVGSAPAAFAQVPIADATHSGGTSQLLNTGLSAWFDDATWKPVTPVIVANTTLYVTTTGNDSTALPNDPTHPFLTIQGALNWLSAFQIFTGIVVTIQVAAGVYNTPQAIIVNHPQGQSIQIIGSVGSPISTTGASMSGSTVNLTAASGAFSGINVGDYIFAKSLSTVNSITESGVFKVATCNGTTLTYLNIQSSPIAISGSNFTVVKASSVLIFGAGSRGINVTGNGLGLLQNFAIVGTASGSIAIAGVQASNSAVVNLSNVGTIGWKDSVGVSSAGIEAFQGANISAVNCFSNGNNNGFLSVGFSSNIACVNCYANFNSKTGYWSNSSSISCNSSYAMGNGYAGSGGGFYALGNATIGLSGPQCIASYNAAGVVATINSSLVVSTTSGFSIGGNTVDVTLSRLSSLIRADGVNAMGWSTKSGNITAPNTLTADGCYFSP